MRQSVSIQKFFGREIFYSSTLPSPNTCKEGSKELNQIDKGNFFWRQK